MEKIRPTLIRVGAQRLIIDKENPRLPESVPKNNNEEIWRFMKSVFDLDELALSIQNNGYFEAEPLVVVPSNISFSDNQIEQYKKYHENPQSQFIVVEGNRRLATIQGLLKGKLLNDERLPYQISDNVRAQLEHLPALFYPNRESVINFLGVHHLAGVRKWNVYERARYIVHLTRNRKYSIKDIQNIIGDRKNSAKKTYICYRLIEILQEYDESFGISDAKDNFSFLQLATGQGPIRAYIGLPTWNSIEGNTIENPIPKEKYENLKNLFLCLFNSSYGRSLIGESREITSRISKILVDKEATKYLFTHKDLESAFEMVGGTAQFFNTLAGKSKRNLESISGQLTTFNFSGTQSQKEKNKLTATISDIQTIIAEIQQKLNKK